MKTHNSVPYGAEEGGGGIYRTFVPIRERRFCRSSAPLALSLCVILGMAIRVSSSLPDSFMHWLPAGEQVKERREGGGRQRQGATMYKLLTVLLTFNRGK